MRSTILNIQGILAKAGFYDGKIDGDFGAGSEGALLKAMAVRTRPRAVVQAVQQALKDDGYYDGLIDGGFGDRSRGALEAAKTAALSAASTRPRGRLTTAQIVKKYGTPNNDGTYLTTITLPFPLRISWDLDETVKTMRVHRLAATAFTNVFNDLLAHYGLARIQELGIDLFGGCFNFRKMRGGNEWSRHSWGIAIDLDPARNTLKATSKTARFARPEYRPMIEIFAKHGFISYGVLFNFDWMHFELAV